MGCVGCGAVCQVRELDGGVSVASGASVYCLDWDILEGPLRRESRVAARSCMLYWMMLTLKDCDLRTQSDERNEIDRIW
jgi:hypothetical protein